MLFNSYAFLIFFPVVVLLYYLVPKWSVQKVWLLAASYFFYMSWNPKYIILILTSTLITYVCGILIEKFAGKNNRQKQVIAAGFVVNLGILFFFKYFNFFLDTITRVLSLIHIKVTTPAIDVLLPVGISFYTFQALSYIVDVYRGEIKAEKNFINYALFVSFFPQLVAGPIERSKNLLVQIQSDRKLKSDNIRYGLLLMLWGYFEKIVIADRAAIIVDEIFDHYQAYNGLYIIIGALFFAIQIYCDFGGYSHIAIGAAEVMGFSLMNNFRQPYFSESIKEFWKRWHISLSTWFRDYLYIPLGGSRCSRIRTYFNLMVTFLVSGLWHGASWHFVFWGGLNGIFQVIGDLTGTLRKHIFQILKINTDCGSFHLLKKILTFILVDFAWIFFRAPNVHQAIGMVGKSFEFFNPWILFDGSLYKLGVSRTNFGILIISMICLLAVDILHERRFSIRGWYVRQNLVFRWCGYLLAVLILVLFGVYGITFDAAQFLYFQF